LQQIKIDFFTRCEVYGVEVLSVEDMVRDCRDHNGVSVVSDPVLLLDKWLFHLLVGQPLHNKYDADFAAIAQSEVMFLISKLSLALPKPRAISLVAEMAQGKGSAIVLSKRERLHALARLWSAQGARAVFRSIHFAAFRLRDQFKPHGIFLSISGPDGSGKTTIINMVTTQLNTIYGDGTVTYSHFRPTVLPRIAAVAKKARAVETIDVSYDQPHRAKPSGLAGSAARLAYYWLDYMGGYFRTVRPVLKRREIVLFDRYYYDMIADPFRSRIALPTPILRFMGRLLPLPQYAFFIRVAPEEVRRRKQELTLAQIIKLNKGYENLVRNEWLIPIENNNAPEDAAVAIVDHIVAKRHEQALRHLK